MIRMSARQAAKLTGDKPRSKYGARRTEYRGVMYDSKREAQYAAELDVLMKIAEVVEWDRQIKLPLHVLGLSPKPIGYYVADFAVSRNDGTRSYVDVKGFDTPLSKWKRKHAEAEYGIKIEIVR